MRRRPARCRNAWRYLRPLVDWCTVVLAFGLAYVVRYEWQWFVAVEPRYSVRFAVYVPIMLFTASTTVLVLWLEGAYRESPRGLFDDVYIAARGTLISIAAIIFVVFLATPSFYSRLIIGFTGVITLLFLGATRTIERLVRGSRYRRGLGVRRLLIVSAGEVGHSVMRAIVARPELGYSVVGYVDDDPVLAGGEIGRFRGLGTIDSLPEVVAQHKIDEVVVTLPWTEYARINWVMQVCEQAGLLVRVVPDLFQMTLNRVRVDTLDGIPVLSVDQPALRDWQRVLKRVIDVVIAALGLAALSPLLLIVGIAIKCDSPGPVIFRQRRVGRDGREFTCLKFRTMHEGAEARLAELQSLNEASGPIFKMRHDPRRTRVGQTLRRLSIDELPQLWNVLKGDMSLIGPRPPIPSEVVAYEPWHRRRLEVAPGITGLWQVSGRSNLSFDEMVLLDVYYIENWSPWLDLRILLKTLPTVLSGSGAY